MRPRLHAHHDIPGPPPRRRKRPWRTPIVARAGLGLWCGWLLAGCTATCWYPVPDVPAWEVAER